MSKMITIKGKKVSEDTIVEALKKHIDFTIEKPHAGDYYTNNIGERRLVLYNRVGKHFEKSGYSIVNMFDFSLVMFNNYTYFATLSELQEYMEINNYIKES